MYKIEIRIRAEYIIISELVEIKYILHVGIKPSREQSKGEKKTPKCGNHSGNKYYRGDIYPVESYQIVKSMSERYPCKKNCVESIAHNGETRNRPSQYILPL
jgi:hypothetical protein